MSLKKILLTIMCTANMAFFSACDEEEEEQSAPSAVTAVSRIASPSSASASKSRDPVNFLLEETEDGSYRYTVEEGDYLGMVITSKVLQASMFVTQLFFDPDANTSYLTIDADLEIDSAINVTLPLAMLESEYSLAAAITLTDYKVGFTNSNSDAIDALAVLSADELSINVTLSEPGTVSVEYIGGEATPEPTPEPTPQSLSSFIDGFTVTPSRSLPAGGGTLTLVGEAEFGSTFEANAGAKVFLGSGECTTATKFDADSLTCTIPAASAGAVDLTVVYNDETLVTLSGVFTYGSAAVLSIQGGLTSKDFGTTPVGTVAYSSSITLVHAGDFSATSISGSTFSEAAFGYLTTGVFPGYSSSDACEGTLGSAGTCKVNIKFYPTSAGSKEDTLTISYHDGFTQKTLTFDYDGTGATPGSLDTIFDSDGKLTLLTSASDLLYDITLDNSRNLTAGGLDSNVYLKRFDYAGAADTGFDGTAEHGTTFSNISGCFSARLINRMHRNSDGTFWAAGKCTIASAPGAKLILAKFSSDGSFDTSFDTDGYKDYDVATMEGVNATTTGVYVSGMDVDSSGNVYVVGYIDESNDALGYVIKIKPDGSADTDFDSDGLYTAIYDSKDTEFTDVEVIAVSGTESLFITASTSSYGRLIKMDMESAALDGDFATSGIKAFFGWEALALSSFQGGARVVVAGGNQRYVGVFNSTTGSYDGSFSSNGYSNDGSNINDKYFDVTTQSINGSEKIIAVGFSGNDFLVSRYNADGSGDSNFDSDGHLTIDGGESSEKLYRIQKSILGQYYLVGRDGNNSKVFVVNP